MSEQSPPDKVIKRFSDLREQKESLRVEMDAVDIELQELEEKYGFW